MKIYLTISTLLSIFVIYMLKDSQNYELELSQNIKRPIVLAPKIQAQPILTEPSYYEEDVVEEVEIIVWGESKRIKTELDTVLIFTEGYFPCGCQPNYPPIRIHEEIQDDEEEQSLFAEPIYIDPYVFETKVYPNPSQWQSTLEIDIEQEEQFEIEMYDMNGRKIRDIHSGQLFTGVNRFTLDIDQLTAGMYLITVRSEHQQETLKLQKLN